MSKCSFLLPSLNADGLLVSSVIPGSQVFRGGHPHRVVRVRSDYMPQSFALLPHDVLAKFGDLFGDVESMINYEFLPGDVDVRSLIQNYVNFIIDFLV